MNQSWLHARATQTLHQPWGLIRPSTTLQVFDPGMKFRQAPHDRTPLGVAWYCTLPCCTVLVTDIEMGVHMLQPLASAGRRTDRRDEFVSIMMRLPP